jgi:L-lactate dehydrogenase complex protein LldF
VFSPLLSGVSAMPSLPHASSLCGACQAACPVDIAIPDMLLKLRRDLVQQGGQGIGWRLGMKLWQLGMQSPTLYKMGGWAAKIATNLIKNKDGVITRVPPPFSGWTDYRDFKPFAGESFRERYRKRKSNTK